MRGEIARIGADQSGEMGAGAVADQHDPPIAALGVGALAIAAATSAACCADAGVRHEPVVDRSEGIAAAVEMGRHMGGDALVAEAPGAAMDEQDQRRVAPRGRE